MKKHALFLIIFLLYISGYSQNFEKFLGGSQDETIYYAQQTTDGGYICAGTSSSSDGDLSGNFCPILMRGPWIVKLSQSGNIQWQKCLGINSLVHSIKQTGDGGYIVGGTNFFIEPDLIGNHGGSDFYIAKLDNIGNIQWQKLLGGRDNDHSYSIQQTKDGGYIIAGETDSNDGDVSGNHGFADFWIIKLSSAGNIQWQNCLGGTGYERTCSIQQTVDGGYVIAGATGSNDGDVSENHGSGDIWVARLNKRGNIQWQKSFGGSGEDGAFSIQQTHGGYIIAGYSYSNDGDVTGNHGNGDMWIVKLSNTGKIQWQKCFGGTCTEIARSIRQTTDGGYIITGNTSSMSPFIPSDVLLVKISKLGIVEQEQTFGTSDGYDFAHSMNVTADGGCIIAGVSSSSYKNGTGTHGRWDGWILRLGAIGSRLSTTKSISEKSISDNLISIYPNPASNEIQVNTIENMRNLPYKVYDQSGKSVLKGKLNENYTTITISSLSKGIYILSIGDKVKTTRKIIKE